MKFNKLTIISKAGKDKWGSLLVNCVCDCGKEVVTRFSDIKVNKTLQCRECGYKYKRKGIPVLKSPIAGKGNNYRHGLCKTKTYATWSKMIDRCNAPIESKDYRWYGSRNITVCQRWLKFENFYEDMGIKPSKMYLDRINNDLGYFKENCRWVDAKTNSRNRRCVKNNE